MKFMKKLVMVLLVMILAAPAFAVDYFSATGSGTASVEVDVHSKAQPGFLTGKGKIVVTHLTGYSDLVGVDLEVKGFIPGCAYTTVSVATAAAQAVISVASTLEFDAGEYIFIEDKTISTSFESAEIASIGTLETITLVQNLAYGYSKGSKVWQIKNVANYEPWAVTPTTEVVRENTINVVNVPAGSPLSVWLTGTAACKVNVSGFKE